jgi:5'-nucleotidase
MSLMNSSIAETLTIAISSRALFDLAEANAVFESLGSEAYAEYQIAHEDEPLLPGGAFALVKKLLALNKINGHPLVDIVLVSRNSADTGLRVFNSIAHYDLDIQRAAFTSGVAPYRYLANFGAQLFLSQNQDDVRHALDAGVAAATILPSKPDANNDEVLRIAFDGDAVLFSDESERIYQASGISAFNENEMASRNQPLPGGPFKPFLAALHHIQTLFPPEQSPIRTALVTARGAPAHERVIRTLRDWRIRTDEALFLAGKNKGEFLKSFGADIFFDDQQRHCESAALERVAAGHVPFGIKNVIKH